MSSCTVKLQEILLPSNEDFEDAQALFFRRDLSRESCLDRMIPEQKRWDFIIRNGEKIPLSDEVTDAVKASIPPETSGVEYDKQSNSVFIPAGDLADFSCYLNMFSASKWHKLTYAGDVTLNLELQGTGAVHVLAYRVSPLATQQDIMDYLDYRNELFYMKTGREKPVEEGLRHLHSEVIKSIAFKQEERTVISIPVGQQSATLLGFVVEGIGASVRVFGGNWSASVERDQKRDVDLCLVTTTFQKEQYITHNIELLESMLAGNAELSEHFQIIVVDNGRTLNAADLESNHVRVYPNINVGGAGGFARGMMETLKLEKRPSHVLIMDDDVLVLPESIERTYALLSLLRPAYWDYYLSGAMLRMEEKTVQHEDIGHVSKYGFFEPKKPPHSLVTIYDCAINDAEWMDTDYEYAAWWYCCIPMKFISEKTLPIPIFIRGDDVEFALRNEAKIMSLNGICVWHMGFNSKFSAQMEYYQVIRNSFIFHAFHESAKGIDFMDRVAVLFNELTCSFAYDYVDLLIDALEDYLKGPSILEEPNGIDIIQEKGKKNEKLLPYAEVCDQDIDFGEMFRGMRIDARSTLRRKLTTFTRNGQQFLRIRGKGTGVVPYDWGYYSDFVAGRAQLISIDPQSAMAVVRKKDLKRFNEVKARYNAILVRYEHENDAVMREWKDAYPRLTSLDFWEKYLGLSEL